MLYRERRNFDLWKELVDPDVESRWKLYSYRREEVENAVGIILPIQTILKVDRIYIRKGLPDFNSITFWLEESPLLKIKKKKRFWTKLADANKIECEILES